MGAVIFVTGIIGFLVLFSYLKFPPAYAKPEQVSIFNKMVLGLCTFLCGLWFLNAYVTWAGTPDDKWWVPIGILGMLTIEIVMLSVFFVLRNFWVFKPPRRPGSGLFG